ncbi:hypothetical protein R1flu_010387 [Riccia fluitans]|uniref:Uncharacterized protein n=1 Tax=Riccia fluitans TaxID=41844 RepID=A0ABD1Z5L4_9MARC
MAVLLDEEGREINDEDSILERVYKYYANLYSQPNLSYADCREQEKVLTMVDHRVSEEANRRLLETPGVDELTEAIKNLPLDKAPGEDRLPAEILRDLWKEISAGCLQFIQEEIGCQILLPGQFITYLGCRFGVEKAEERANDIRNKLQRKLGKWANRFLTWALRLLLL